MQYSKKLRGISKRIEKIMDAEGVAGIVILYEPQISEFLIKLEAPFSAVHRVNVGLDQGFRIRAKAADFKGGEKERNQFLDNTVNMLVVLQDLLGITFMQVSEITNGLRDKFDIKEEHGSIREGLEEDNFIESTVESGITMTSEQWLEQPQFKGLVIQDPDGWDRNNFEYSFKEELITMAEFQERISRSTINLQSYRGLFKDRNKDQLN